MKRLKGKKAAGFIDAYNRSKKTTLAECYRTYSVDKALAYAACSALCYDENGDKFRVISYNSSFFTVAWLVTNCDTGATELRVETPSNSYVMDY